MDTKELRRRITVILRDIGMPAHLMGYAYCRTAIAIVAENPGLMKNITKGLYPLVADEHNTTPSRVERDIRNAIEWVWYSVDLDGWKKYFGNAVYRRKDRPTNSEFIATIVDYLTMEME